MQNLDKIKINLGSNSYEIIIGSNLINNLNNYLLEILPKNTKIFIISDENVANIYSQKILENLSTNYIPHLVTLKAGEGTKSFKNLEFLCNEILKNKPERKSCLIALGGGVVGDITGFVASILLRGMRFIQIPTSLLAMVDSSVGGKTAINSKYGKNLVGSFYQPKLVIADLSLLKTLPSREILSGYAEIVKYGLICDYNFFEYLEGQNSVDNLQYLVKKSCEIKADIVSKDELEKNDLRALLNLGHTFGHALEAICKYDGSLLHGEAVAIGMVLAFQFSEFLNICEIGSAIRVENLLRKMGLRTKISELNKKTTINKLVSLMYGDKKVDNGKLVFVLASAIGKAFVKKDVDEKQLKKFLKQVIL
jgi:3-dehydroquinate synthase